MATKESTPAKKSRNFLVSALSAAISAVLAGAPGAADAQQQGATGPLEEIAVTGSRIRQTTGFNTPTPVTSMTTQQLENLEPESSISEQLDALPQFFQTQTAQRGGGTLFGDAAGSFLNLRGMGKQRTLVLLDGSRTVPADRASSVNVDNFPTALIKSVDVVTGGASAAYGADAIAGVVNFVLDREFEGFKIKASTGVTEEGEGENWNFSVAGGAQVTERLHLIGSLEGRRIDQIEGDPNDFGNFQRWGFVTNPEWFPGAPPGIPRQITLPDVHSTVFTSTGLINQPGFSLDRQTFTDDGTAVRPFILGDVVSISGPGATQTQSGGPEAASADQAFNGGAFGNEVVQRSGFAGFKYDVSDSFNVFGQILAGRTESNTAGRRGNPHLQTDTWHATIFADNAFLPENIRQAMVDEGLDSFRMDKLGQIRAPGITNFFDDRDDRNTSRMWSGTLGADAVLPNGWDVRVSYQHGDSKVQTSARKILRVDRLFLAMDAVVDPNTGDIVCNIALHNPTKAELAASIEGRTVPGIFPAGVVPDSPIGPDVVPSECVPLNVFGNGNLTQAAADYVVDPEKKSTRTLNQEFAELLVTGDLFQGIGAGPFSFAAGLTWRDETFFQTPEPRELERGHLNAPELGIRGVPDGFIGGNISLAVFSFVNETGGDFNVWEIFSEVNAPLWESANGNRRLGVNGAYRSSDYSISGRIASWKAGVDFQVAEDLRLRWTRSRDVREPSFAEQFEVGGGGGNFNDPTFAGANFEISVLSAPNPRLDPEKANTLSAGFVYQPTFAPWVQGLQVSADWYQIKLTDAVGKLGQQRIVDECFFNNAQDLCDLITRDPITQIVQIIANPNLNISSAKTEGVDMEIQYSREPDFFPGQFETFNLRALAGYLIENSDTPGGGRKQDAAGGLNRPEWTGTLTANYQVGPYGIRLTERYYDSTLINVRWVEGVDVDDNTIDAQWLTNLGLTYGRDMAGGGRWQAALDVTNLFDQAPPVVPSVSQRFSSQTISTNFDIFGRRYQLSLNMSF
ncbi:MAG: TonB-dependent receptor [Pseudomonadales bacterium]|nr:TonB-dependent receptor [Pseudomonadales bacterium]